MSPRGGDDYVRPGSTLGVWSEREVAVSQGSPERMLSRGNSWPKPRSEPHASAFSRLKSVTVDEDTYGSVLLDRRRDGWTQGGVVLFGDFTHGSESQDVVFAVFHRFNHNVPPFVPSLLIAGRRVRHPG
jgi:hypothetical protein